MGRHAATPERRWFGRGRTRALLSLGVLGVVGVVGTSASWTDTATVNGGPILAGSMDLQLQTPDSTSTWRLVGSGGTYPDTTLSVTDLSPGESQAFNLAARNVGQPNLTYGATVSQAAGWTLVGNPIQVRFYAGAASRATNTSTYPRSGTCSGTALSAAVTVTNGATVIPSRSLASGASEQLCVVVSMVSSATDSNQGKTGTLQLDFTANQA